MLVRSEPPAGGETAQQREKRLAGHWKAVEKNEKKLLAAREWLRKRLARGA